MPSWCALLLDSVANIYAKYLTLGLGQFSLSLTAPSIFQATSSYYGTSVRLEKT